MPRLKALLPEAILSTLVGIKRTDSRSANPLLALFPESRAAGRPARMAFDWDHLGVSSPYVIFITGRCGSTLLTHLIKDTHLAGAPEEYFNLSLASQLNRDFKAPTLVSYLERIVEQGSCRGRFGFEIDWLHLRQLVRGIDFKGVFPADRTTFFYMTRRDIVAQAWSFATAKATGVWLLSADTSHAAVPGTPPALDDQRIWSEILLILEAEMQMERFFSRTAIRPIRIDYEELVASRRDVLAWVLLNIGCDVDSIVSTVDQPRDRILKIPHDTFHHMLAFRARHKRLLAEVECVRGADYSGIRSSLTRLGLAR